jgi:hypothetical protein
VPLCRGKLPRCCAPLGRRAKGGLLVGTLRRSSRIATAFKG